MESNQISNMVIQADVVITANTPCDLKLQVVLEDVVGADTQEGEAAWFIKALQAYDLHFSYQEGKVEYLCSHLDEDPTVTNFKRGILSALQVSTPDLTPSDIPIVIDEQSCTVKHTDGELEAVECSEEIEVLTSLASYLSPNNTNASNSDTDTPSSALATVKTTSVLQKISVDDFSEDRFVKEGQVWQRTSLAADIKGALQSARNRKPKENNIKEQIETTLASLMESLDSESGRDEHRPHLFTRLVHLLTQMDKDQAGELEAIWDTHTDSIDARNFLLDGLMLCESSVCVQLLSDLTLDQETIGTAIILTPQHITSWLTALHFHHTPQPQSLQAIMVLEDVSEMGEVRMAAYRALIPCAPLNPNFFTKLKYILEQEQDNQVGSYIWSHVNSLIDEPGPSEYEQTMAQLARHYLLPLRFSAPVEDFRTSRNHRFSQFSQLLNLGGSLDTDVIFTPASFLPKRVSANLTLNLLDVSFSALEVGGEFSGVERLLERLFGKEGYFGNEHLLNLVTPGGDKSDATNVDEETNAGGRSKRDIIHEDDETNGSRSKRDVTHESDTNSEENYEKNSGSRSKRNITSGEEEENDETNVDGGRSKRNIIQEDKIQEFQKLYDQGRAGSQTPEVEEEEEETKASMYVRVFGHEVLYLDNLLPINPQQLLSNLLQALSTSKSFQLVDQEYVRVTQLGYPLHVRLNATGSVVFKHDFNIKRTDGGGMSLEFNLAPSVVLAADERLWVDGYMAASGVQRTSTLTAHTQFGGKVSLNQGSLAEAQINVPNSEVTKMSVSSQVSMYDNSKKAWTQQTHTPPQHTTDTCTPEAFNQALGLKEVGGETVSRGSYKTSLAITKIDSFNHYRLYAARNLNQANVLEVLFDTPGSTTDRKVNLIFNARPNNAGGYIVLRSVGYGLKGTYENTDELKELTFEYLQASKVMGKFGVSLKKEVEGSETHLTPSLVVTLEPDTYSLGGKLSYAVKDREGLHASLSMDGTWQKVEDGRESTEAFGQAAGDFAFGRERAEINASAEYGNNRTNTHTLSANVLFHKGKGNALLQVSSQVIVKRLSEEGNRDYHLKASLESQQLELDYIGELLFKTSENGFQAETEVKVDNRLHSRIILMYLSEHLHHLAGVHLTLNEFVAEVGHEVDLSQPHRALITVTGTGGELSGGLHLAAKYSPDLPLNTSLSVYGSRAGETLAKASVAITSDQQWTNFTAGSQIQWFDWTHSLQHNVLLEHDKLHLLVSSEGGNTYKLISETSPGHVLQFSMWSESEEETPQFQVGYEHRASNLDRVLNVNMSTGEDVLFHFGFTLESSDGNRFNSSLRLLESELAVGGRLDSLPGTYLGSALSSNFNGSAEATVTLPSGQSVKADLTLTHILDGDKHTLVATSSQGDATVKGTANFMSVGGWFEEDVTSLDLTITTPLDHLAQFGLAFHRSTDPTQLNFAEIFLDDMKMRGEVQVGERRNLTLGLEYQKGDQCSTRLYAHHREHDDLGVYTSLLGLELTKDHLWEAALNTTLGHPGIPNALSSRLILKAPVLTSPIALKASYNLTQDLFGIEVKGQSGEEDEVVMLVSGKRKWTWQRHLLHALGEFRTPWTEPLALNATYDYTQGFLNVNLEFESSLEYLSSWNAELGVNYAVPQVTKAHFILNHPEIQSLVNYVHNYTDDGLSQQLDGNVNGFTMTYNADLEFDTRSVAKVSGHMNLFNLFDHSLGLTLTHGREMDALVTEITGNWDKDNFKIDHMLKFTNSEKWSNSLQLELLGGVGVTKAQFSLESSVDFPSINGTLDFSSQWTDDYSQKLTLQIIESRTVIKSESVYGDSTLLSLTVASTGPLTSEQSDLELEASSSYFEDLTAKWKHHVRPGHLVLGEITYGDEFHAHINSELKMEEKWNGEQFSSYDLMIMTNITSLGHHSKAGIFANAKWSGEVELKWNDYYLQLTSTLWEDRKVEMVLSDEMTEYRALLNIDLVNRPRSLTFNFTNNGESVVTLEAVAESLFPKLEVLTTLELHGLTNTTSQKAKLKISVDRSNFDKDEYKGSAELESNLLGLEELEGKLDLDLKLVNLLHWAGDVSGQLVIQDQRYNVDFNCSLHLDNKVEFEFGTKFESSQGNLTENLKELSLIASWSEDHVLQGKIGIVTNHTSPPWAVEASFNARSKQFIGSVMPGSGDRYELLCQLSSRTLNIEVQKESQDGSSKFKILKGNITWLVRKTKKLITLYMTSDFDAIAKMSGQTTIQWKRDNMALETKFKVNDDNFKGTLRYLRTLAVYRAELKMENEIYAPFTSDVIVELTLLKQGIKFDLTVNLNDTDGWLAIGFKLSRPESWLKIKTPLTQFPSIAVILTTMTGDVNGATLDIHAPQFCFNITGEAHRDFNHAKITTSLFLNCTGGGDPVFDFSLKGNQGSNPVTLSGSLAIPQLIDPIRLNITGILTRNIVNITAETQLTSNLSMGLNVIEQFKDDQWFLQLLYYDPQQPEDTIFFFKNTLSRTEAEFKVDLPKSNQTIALALDYEIQQYPYSLNATLFNSILNYTLNGNLSIVADMAEKIGKVGMSFNADRFDSNAQVTLSYDIESPLFNKWNLMYETAGGIADADFIIQVDDTIYSMQANMKSHFHTHHVYSFNLRKELDGPEENLVISTEQDEIKFNFNGVRKITDGRLEMNGTLTTEGPNYTGYEKVDLQWVQPTDPSSDVIYSGKLKVLLYGETTIMFEGTHNPMQDVYEAVVTHNISSKNETYAARVLYQNDDFNFREQRVTLFLTVPHFKPEEVTLDLTYDVDNNNGSVMFDTPRGRMGMSGRWNYEIDRYIGGSLTTYLSYFDLGQYTVDMTLPLTLSEDARVKVYRQHPRHMFITELFIGDSLSKLNISHTFNSTSDPVNRTYSFSYSYDGSLTLIVQLDEWYSKLKLILSGSSTTLPFTSGNFEFMSNTSGYEEVEGNWHMAENNGVYSGQVQIELQRWGQMLASFELDLSRSPWENVRLSAQFESPFTLKHVLHAEYNLQVLSLVVYYKCGPDIFQVKGKASIDRISTSFELVGNVPIKGLSSFLISYSSTFEPSYSVNFVAEIEDSKMKGSFEVNPDWKEGSVKFSLASPFTRPAKAVIDWSLSQSPFKLQVIIGAGDYTGKMRTALEYTRNSADFEHHMTTTYGEQEHSINVKFSYKFSDSGFDGTLVANANNNFLKLKSNVHITRETVLLKFTGILEAFGALGSVKVDMSQADNIYKGSIRVELPDKQRFHINVHYNSYQLQGKVMYQTREVFSVSLTKTHVKIQLMWDEYWAFNVEYKLEYKAKNYTVTFSLGGFEWEPSVMKIDYFHGRIRKLNVTLDSPFTSTTNLKMTYTAAANHKLAATLTIGEDSYQTTAVALLRSRRSSVEVRFTSSQDTTANPVRIAAEYNIREFMVGRMNSVKPLGSLVLDWGQRFMVNITGLHKDSRVKVDAVITTPYKEFPRLLLGYDGIFSVENSVVDIGFKTYINGTRDIVLSGYTKLSGNQVDLNWALDTTYPGLKKLATTLMLTPGQAKVSLQHNDNQWKIDCEYQLSPSLSIVCKVETPMNGFDEIDLSLTAQKKQDDKYSSNFKLTWPESQNIELNMELEKWKADIKLQTPWEPIKVCSLHTSLTTESERLAFSSDLQWDERKAKTSLKLDPHEVEFAAKYEVDFVTVSEIKVKGERKGDMLKISLDLTPPISSLKSIRVSLDAKPQEFEAKLDVNDVSNSISGKYSTGMGEFNAEIPLLGDFDWFLKAENDWLKLESELRLTIPYITPSPPVLISLKYDVKPDNKVLDVSFKMSTENGNLFSFTVSNVDDPFISVSVLENHIKITFATSPDESEFTLSVSLETERLDLEKVSTLSIKEDRSQRLYDLTTRVVTKVRDDKTLRHKLHLTASSGYRHKVLNVELEGDLIAIPYTLQLKLPTSFLYDANAELEIEVKEGDKELFVLTYKIDTRDWYWGTQHTLKAVLRGTPVEVHVGFNPGNTSALVTFPKTQARHFVVLFWSHEDLTWNNFKIGVELDSAVLPHTPLKLQVEFSAEGEYQVNLKVSYNSVGKKFTTKLDLRYDRLGESMTGNIMVESDWHGVYTFSTNSSWRRDLELILIIVTPSEKHLLSAHVNPVDYTWDLSLRSPWLAVGEISFTGELNDDFSLTNMNLESRLKAGENEHILNARLYSASEGRSKFSILLYQGDIETFNTLLEWIWDDVLKLVELKTFNIWLPELATSFRVYYESLNPGISLVMSLKNDYYLDTGIGMNINIREPFYDIIHTVGINIMDFTFRVEVKWAKYVNLRIGSYCQHAKLYVSLEHDAENLYEFLLASTHPSLEFVNLFVIFPPNEQLKLRYIYKNSWNTFDLDATLHHDQIFGSSLEMTVLSPYLYIIGERMVLKTPRYVPGKYIGALIEVYNTKYGAELSRHYDNVFDANLIFSLYLPYESSDIISLQYVFLPRKVRVEAIFGRIGLGLSLVTRDRTIEREYEVMAFVNEMRIITRLIGTSTLQHKVAYKVLLWDNMGITQNYWWMEVASLRLDTCEGLQTNMNLNAYQAKLNLGWGNSKSLEIQTPMLYPGYTHIIYTCDDVKNHYKLELGVSPQSDNDTWEIYQLDLGYQPYTFIGGRTWLVIDGFGTHLATRGTLHLDNNNYVNMISFELNEHKLGYNTEFHRIPGLLSVSYENDVEVFLTNRTIVHKSLATRTLTQTYSASHFTWNAEDNDMPPIRLSTSYVDNSLFGYEKHFLTAEFMHPDIQTIVLEGNLTRPLNSSLYAVLELTDYYVKEKRIAMVVEVPLVNNEGDFWQFDTQVNKIIPEMKLSLQTDHETRRARIGLHSPVAAGALLEHRKFGQRWNLDAGVGVTLTLPCVLKVFASHDPTLIKSNNTLVRLASPAPHIWSTWVQDITTVVHQLQELTDTEIPLLYEALVSNKSVSAIRERVLSNWEYLIDDVTTTTNGFADEASELWFDHLQPAWRAVHNFTTTGYETTMTAFLNFTTQAFNQGDQTLQFLSTQWTDMKDGVLVPAAEWFEELTGGMAGHAWTAITDFVLDSYQTASTTLKEWMTQAQDLMAGLITGVSEWANHLSESIQESVNVTLGYIQPTMDYVSSVIISYKDDVTSALYDSCWQSLVEKFENLVTVQQGVGEAVTTFTEFLQPNEYLTRFNLIKDTLLDFSTGIWSKVEDVWSEVHPAAVQSFDWFVTTAQEKFTGLSDGLGELNTDVNTKGIYAVMNEKVTHIQTTLSGLYEAAVNGMTEAKEAIYTYVTEQPLFTQLEDALSDVTDWATTEYSKWSSGDRKELNRMERLIFPVADLLNTFVNKGNLMDRLYVVKPWSHGVIQYIQYFPLYCHSFFEPWDWQRAINIFHDSPITEAEKLLANGAEESMDRELWRLLAFPYSYLPSLSATATIAGQHVRTFDGSHHQFLGSCSYLLAKDFVGGEFEITGVYGAGGRGGVAGLEAIRVHGPKADVTMYVSGKVTDNAVVSPAKMYETRIGCVLVLPDLVVYCNNITSTCAISVSPKYYNRLDGLLGTYNHDPHDDSRGPGSKVDLDDPAVLARLWSVSPSPCYLANQANTVIEPHAAPKQDVITCLDLFLRSPGPLSPCFGLVDPRPYFRDCLAGRRHPTRGPRHLLPPCHAASAYIVQCQTRGLYLSPLVQCQQGTPSEGCTLDDTRKVTLGWSHTYQEGEGRYGGADVALVVETALCNQGKDIRTLLNPINDHLSRRNMRDVRYAIVTIPGTEDDTTETHGDGTIEEAEFMTRSEAAQHLRGLSYTGGYNASHPVRAYTVANAARKLKWRPGVTRTLVHVGCGLGGCGTKGLEVDVLGALRDNDVTYHLMTDFDIVVSGTRREAKARERKLFGFDEALAYTVPDYRSFRGNDRVRGALSVPDGVCVEAAIASGGSVFSRNKWNTNKRTQTTKLLGVFGERVAVTSSRQECQECVCQGSGVVRCRRCFADPMFYLPRSYTSKDRPGMERDSIDAEIVRNFHNEFFHDNEGFDETAKLSTVGEVVNGTDDDSEVMNEVEEDDSDSEDEDGDDSEDEVEDGGEDMNESDDDDGSGSEDDLEPQTTTVLPSDMLTTTIQPSEMLTTTIQPSDIFTTTILPSDIFTTTILPSDDMVPAATTTILPSEMLTTTILPSDTTTIIDEYYDIGVTPESV
ncbi:hypothetical protein Pmani_035287 [Petrolisthes manimaculis]|uniref:Apolipophorin n=1 Tax=Petrolisthes manimaculis TaxID=1843537 RepID=A0AAE1NM21_9EUCA|nr:hypothetical protein Pmani_035287 [Petrolisthes manimaculis]